MFTHPSLSLAFFMNLARVNTIPISDSTMILIYLPYSMVVPLTLVGLATPNCKSPAIHLARARLHLILCWYEYTAERLQIQRCLKCDIVLITLVFWLVNRHECLQNAHRCAPGQLGCYLRYCQTYNFVYCYVC
jgi:hypothetical protein